MNVFNNIIGHELVHLLLTALVALFLWRRYRDLKLILVAFLIGIFIDIDHLFDYWVYFGLSFNLADFFNVASYVYGSQKVYVLLHGWEFLLIFGLLAKVLEKKLKIKGLMWAVVLSYGGHLLWDYFSFSHHPLAYLLTYRLLNSFSLRSFNGF